MRRALVISLIVHLVVLTTLFQFRPFPPQSVFSQGDWVRLSVNLVGRDWGEAPSFAGHQRRPQIAMPVSARHVASKTSVELDQRKPLVGKGLPQIRVSEEAVLQMSNEPEVLRSLPANLEAEYRLNLVREIRKIQHAGNKIGAYSHSGSVNLLISRHGGLPGPIVSVSRSSGHPLLDDWAVNSLSLALGKVALPNLSGGASFQMPFVLEYRANP